MKPFEYFEPATVTEATQLLSHYGERARVLAGGVDLVPRMRKGDITADQVVNIQKIRGLDSIESQDKQGLVFGAMAKLYSLEMSEPLQRNFPILFDAIHQITSVQAKHMGTAVGNLCVGTPASDVATALFTLGAQLKIAGPKGERTEPIENFYLDHRRTSLQQGEMVTGVFLPNPSPGTGTAFLNLVRTHADIAKVSVAVAVITRDGICREARIAIGSAAPTVFRAAGAEADLIGQKGTPQVIHQAAATAAGQTRPISDVRSSAEYRQETTRVLVRRALEKAWQKARG
jgi:carbon-monoxide dehydrogenase medium subunit